MKYIYLLFLSVIFINRIKQKVKNKKNEISNKISENRKRNSLKQKKVKLEAEINKEEILLFGILSIIVVYICFVSYLNELNKQNQLVKLNYIREQSKQLIEIQNKRNEEKIKQKQLLHRKLITKKNKDKINKELQKITIEIKSGDIFNKLY